MTDQPATAAPWRHARWFEPHTAVVDEAKPIRPRQRHDGTTQESAACSTCGEVLIRDC